MMDYKEQIDKCIHFLEKEHLDFYFSVSKEDLEKYVIQLEKRYPLKDDYDFYYVMNCIIKYACNKHDSHTMMYFKKSSFTPIKMHFIQGIPYITYIHESYAKYNDLLYSEVIGINGVDMKQIEKELEAIIPYSTKGWLYDSMRGALTNISVIKSLPSIQNNCQTITFEVLDKHHEKKKIKISLPAPNINIPAKPYIYWELKDNIIVIHYWKCRENYENQMQQIVKEISEVAEKNNIHQYIVDIRNNQGGNSNIINPLIHYLDGKDIITLVNNGVFSSGRFALEDLQRIGSKVIGCDVGTSLNAFGDMNPNKMEMDSFILGTIKTYWYCDTSKHMIYGQKSKKEFKEFKKDVKNKAYLENDYFKPDIYVENSIDDYRNGYDRVLDTALQEFKDNKRVR